MQHVSPWDDARDLSFDAISYGHILLWLVMACWIARAWTVSVVDLGQMPRVERLGTSGGKQKLTDREQTLMCMWIC